MASICLYARVAWQVYFAVSKVSRISSRSVLTIPKVIFNVHGFSFRLVVPQSSNNLCFSMQYFRMVYWKCEAGADGFQHDFHIGTLVGWAGLSPSMASYATWYQVVKPRAQAGSMVASWAGDSSDSRWLRALPYFCTLWCIVLESRFCRNDFGKCSGAHQGLVSTSSVHQSVTNKCHVSWRLGLALARYPGSETSVSLLCLGGINRSKQ